MDTPGDEPSSVAVVGRAGGVGGGTPPGPNNATRKRFAFARVVPEQGKKRVNYGKGDARRIMEEAVSLCEAMTLGYEVVFHGRRRSFAGKSGSISDGTRYIHKNITTKLLLAVGTYSSTYLPTGAHRCRKTSIFFVIFVRRHNNVPGILTLYHIIYSMGQQLSSLSQTAQAKPPTPPSTPRGDCVHTDDACIGSVFA